MNNSVPTILLVEDDPNDVVFIERAVRKSKLPYRLERVSDVKTAKEYLKGMDRYADRSQFPLPRLILLDLKLRGAKGHELLLWLRAQPALRRLPVAVLTSSTLQSDINEAYDSGASSYLVKPLEPAAWVDLLLKVAEYWMELCQHPSISLPGGEHGPARAAD